MISESVYPELKSTGKLEGSGANFSIWKFKIDFVLVDNKVDYVVTQPKPAEPPADSKWLSDDVSARDLILNTLDESFRYQFYQAPTAKSIMDRLTLRFNQSSITSRMILFQKYKEYRMPEHEHINRHLLRMRAMANELELAGVRMPDELQAVALLNSLPESWKVEVSGLIAQLDTSKEDCCFDNLGRRLRAISYVKKWNGGEYIQFKKGFQGNCYFCGNPDHLQVNCPNQVTSNENNPVSESHNLAVTMDTSATYFQIVYSTLKTFRRLDHKGRHFKNWKKQLYQILHHIKVKYVLEQNAAPGPSESMVEEDANLHQKWVADDFTCRHLILGSMDDCLLLGFRQYPTAKSLMDALDIYFNSFSIAHRLVLFRKYVNYQMTDNTPIIDHIFKMESMVRKLANAGVQIPDELQAAILMASVPNSWDNSMTAVRVQMDLDKGEALTLNYVVEKLKDVGAMREWRIVEDVAPKAHKGTRKKFNQRFDGN